MNNNIYSEYKNKYSLSKTLRFELKPHKKTEEFIEKDGIIAEDTRRAEEYKQVKQILDSYYKAYMERTLAELSLQGLEEYYAFYMNQHRSEKEDKEFEKLEADLRKQVAKALRDDEKYNILFKKEIITQELGEFVGSKEEKEVIEKFAKFCTYFNGFFENRKNMFTEEKKSTAVSYRVINQNLPKFIDNMRIFEKIMSTKLCVNILEMQRELENELQGRRIEDFFELNTYSSIVTNKDITLYNAIIGGTNTSEGKKIKGINEYINIFNQENKKDKSFRKLPKLKMLYKQILADRTTLSFVEEAFTEDQQVLDNTSEVVRSIYEQTLQSTSENSLEKLLKSLKISDLNKIYIKNGPAITELSNAIWGDWSLIKNALEQDYDEQNPKKAKNKTEKYFDERAKALKSVKSYSLEQINQVMIRYGNVESKVQEYYSSMGGTKDKNLIQVFEECYESAQDLLNCDYYSKHGLASDKKNVAILKQLLDSLKDIENFIKPLLGAGDEAEKDDVFYGELDVIYKIINEVTPLYNKVRNYVTKKPYSKEKIKLNFQKATLLNGWDRNKEPDNLAVILRKDGLYYLGIMNRNNNKIFAEDIPGEVGDCFEKMDYKLLPGASKMLPKVFFAKSNLDFFAPSAEILEIYEKGTFKKGQDFNLSDCHKLIDFYKESIEKHEDWSQFGFKFRETKEYGDIGQFYHEVEKQGYSIKFKKVSTTYINEMVESGKLYLFKIYNKDFSSHSKGTPNLHTIYWKMLFDEANLKNVVYKLNGEAEIFFRKASISKENMVCHEKEKPIARKGLKAREQNATSLFVYDIIKDKRYTVKKYQFHVPITMNFSAEGRSYINDEVLDTIRNNSKINVIGIDRGERNLLYISVIDSAGKILEQKSLNIVSEGSGEEQDYHALLNKKEKEMDSARKNWMEIESIKELKEGYLSQAIHMITELMLRYHAIVVLEDLNAGFMNGRKKVGKQVYQKFEKMLIDKLNYLVDKKINPEEEGGALQAYQLANEFESFTKLGKQSGFLFYIPAWNTSKIDPMTGFVNLLYPKYTSEAAAKNFISKFDAIRYNEEKDYFEFSFSYKNFTEKAAGIKDKWTICSHGSRLVNFRNASKNSEWDTKAVDITKQIKEHLENQGIDIHKDNLVEEICKINNPAFFKAIIDDIKLILQIRNSWLNKDIDYMLSPVCNEAGKFFDTRKYDPKDETNNYYPENADANGAYNIARKGLMLLDKIRETDSGKVKLTITNKEWLEYAQRNPLTKR